MARPSRFVVVATVFLLPSVGPALAEKPAEKAKAKVELRWAEWEAVEGLTEAKGIDLSCSDKKAYLHKKPALTNADVASARLDTANASPEEKYFVIVKLTEEAAKRMAASSAENQDKPLVTLVDGKVAAAVIVKLKLSDVVPITGYFTKAEADRIAAALNPK